MAVHLLMQVVHAGGSFVQGSVVEMGATAVLGGPHVLMRFQGGVHWSQWVNVLSEFVSGATAGPQEAQPLTGCKAPSTGAAESAPCARV